MVNEPKAAQQWFCSPDLINIDNLVSDMDDRLFYSILKNQHHILYQLLLPERSDCSYTLSTGYWNNTYYYN